MAESLVNFGRSRQSFEGGKNTLAEAGGPYKIQRFDAVLYGPNWDSGRPERACEETCGNTYPSSQLVGYFVFNQEQNKFEAFKPPSPMIDGFNAGKIELDGAGIDITPFLEFLMNRNAVLKKEVENPETSDNIIRAVRVRRAPNGEVFAVSVSTPDKDPSYLFSRGNVGYGLDSSKFYNADGTEEKAPGWL